VIQPPSDQLADNPDDMLDPLFSGTPVTEAIDDRRRQALASVAVLSRTELLESGLDDLVAERVKLYRLRPLVLNWKGKRLAPGEVDLMISRLQPGKVAGMAITLLVRFSGMSGLLYMRPSTHIGRAPRGFVWGQKLLLSYFRINPDPTTAQRYLDWQEAAVKEHVLSVNHDVGTFNAELPELLRSAVQARLDKLRAGEDFAVALGVPLADHPVPQAALGVSRLTRPESGRGRIEANETELPNMLAQNSVDPFRAPGWSELSRVTPAQTKEHREAEPSKSGRPPGSGWLIVDRAELLKKYLQLRQRSGRRPLQREFAQSVDMSARTLRTYLKRFGLSWPPE